MDGEFSDLVPDVLAAEVEDLGKEVYKLMRVFQNRFKKMQVNRDEQEIQRKKDYKRRSTIMQADNPQLVALRQSVPEAVAPASIVVCEKVIEQLNDFKVKLRP